MPRPSWKTISGTSRRPLSSERTGETTAMRAMSTRVAMAAELMAARSPRSPSSPHHRLTIGSGRAPAAHPFADLRVSVRDRYHHRRRPGGRSVAGGDADERARSDDRTGEEREGAAVLTFVGPAKASAHHVPGHPERPARVEAVAAGVDALGLGEDLRRED